MTENIRVSLEHSDNLDVPLTPEECGRFFRDSFFYSRGREELQSDYFQYALLRMPSWRESIQKFTPEEQRTVISLATDYVRNSMRAGRHVVRTADFIEKTSIAMWYDFLKKANLDPTPMDKLLLSVAERLIKRDSEFVMYDNPFEGSARKLPATGYSNWKRSFLYDYSVRTDVPLKPDTHHVFSMLFDDLRKFLESEGGIAALDNVSQRSWRRHILPHYQTEKKT